MTSNLTDFKLLQDVFSIRDPGIEEAEDCPNSDTLWDAVEGKLALPDRSTVIRHTTSCQDCAESWRVAMRLGARPKVGVWTHVAYVLTLGSQLIWQDLRLPAELARRWARRIKAVFPALASVEAKMLAAAATAAAAAGALWVTVLTPAPPSLNPDALQRAVTTVGVESLVPSEALPRDRFVLRWSGPKGTVYDLRITTEDLGFLDSASGLTESEYQVPEEKLKDLASGSVLLWQVIPLLPDQHRRDLKTFRAQVE